MPTYTFKPGPEFWWAILVTGVGVLSTAVATQGAVPPTDWRAWAIGVAVGVARAVGGLLLSKASPA